MATELPTIDPTTCVRDWFADEVRRLRLKKGWSQADLAARLFCSEQKVGHWETSYRTPSDVEDCKALDRTFDLDNHFAGMFPHIRREPVPDVLWKLLKAEDEASEVRSYENQVIPGLMQIEAYVREICRVTHSDWPVDDRVATRLDRQKILNREDSPWVWAVLDYPALIRLVGGSEVMKQQYEHLLNLAHQPRVTIQVIPQKTSVHAGLSGPFHICTSPDGTQVAWSDSAGRGRFFDQPNDVANLGIRFDLTRASALSAEDTQDLIKSLLEQL
jgi:transcriptional regulator with XRE-family HTH domain